MTAKELAARQKHIVVGHRGYPHRFPENSLLGYREALRLGVDMIEVDVNLSLDKVPMVIHDDRLDALSGASGFIADYTAAQLEKLDFGGRMGPEFAGLRIPTLYQVCDMVKDMPEAILDIDFKVSLSTWETMEIVLKILGEYRLTDRCVFNCCDLAVIKHLSRDLGLLTVGAPHFYPGTVNFEPGKEGSYAWMWAICIPYADLSKEWADYFHSWGMRFGSVSPERNLPLALKCQMDFAVCDDPIPYLRAIGREPRP